MAVRSNKSKTQSGKDEDGQEEAKVSQDEIAYSFSHLPNYSEKEYSNVTQIPDPILVHKRQVKEELRVDWSGFDRSNLRIDPNLEYPEREEKRESRLGAPLSELVLEDKRRFVIEFLKDAKPETLEKFFTLAVEEAGPSLRPIRPSVVNPQEVVARADEQAAPPQWSARTTGRSLSPVDWIKAHYGNKDRENWDPMGLTRADLMRFDQPLYKAYAQWIGRHKDEALRLPTKSEVVDRKAQALGIIDVNDKAELLRVASTLRMRTLRQK